VWLATPRGGAATVPGAPLHVALKLLRRGLSRWQVDAVAAEVQCLLELGEGHVNIIRPTELLLSRTHLALVTEYAPGGSLADYLRRRGTRLPEQEASYFFRQIVAALQFCHARGIGARALRTAWQPDRICGSRERALPRPRQCTAT
jgi:serine/threonine protein kinase